MIIKITPQIEEMARTLCGGKEKTCTQCDSFALCEFWIEASILHDAGYRKQEWISVEERLPPDGKAVLVVLRNNDMKVQWVEIGIRWHGQWNDVERFIVTHWMPLPEPPEV